MKINYLNFEL